MGRKKPVESFTDEEIVFEHEQKPYRLLRLDPNSMNVILHCLDDGKERRLPFAHLPKAVKQKIRPF